MVVAGTVTVRADSGLLHGSSVGVVAVLSSGSRRGEEGVL